MVGNGLSTESEMSDFGNKIVRSFALFVPIIALKSYCWASMPNLQTTYFITPELTSFELGWLKTLHDNIAYVIIYL